MSEATDFRADVRAWLAQNCPATMRSSSGSAALDTGACWGGRHWVFASDDQRLWLERMVEKGWTVPQWPVDYGGAGLDQEQAKILRQEMAAIGARAPLESFGISMLGPAMLKYGTEEQKQRFLPPIARGEIRWCQGYSEPGAGSDLAGLQTRAEDRGDHFLVNGQKVWTSYADQADWIFCLVRTDTDAPKHQGISFLLFDMESTGVSTKPILLISGASPFCETFFDDVKVPKDQLVGELNKGWDIAKYLLTHEREMISEGFGVGGGAGKPLLQAAIDTIGLDNGQLRDTALRADLARLEIDSAAFAATLERVRDEARSGQGTGAASSLLKYYGTELNKRRHELKMSVGGHAALGWEGEQFDDGRLAREWLRTKANSIEGGTSEVQLNIISKRILGLPG
jgi:alkylation response protein AidB-like acyl-CoA dehydrogenase